ncbi:hypothetical protein GLOTRDRAFT_103590 [Gloeophyllum trabeum ATCC 11539]|uniref:DUF6593 domain-containing protein n=1 Tax=Gloeophyllum trabeum (strain ATCC 11539 / FP-39264 / Madison 617) TaxID=670483 RepID=S7QJS0_GLOTA|nr:uncharacterized protein GLOTRDRAFT_103590 [Gloeophyllum trabeum ATCC 11539]EPQ59592.1 hypothetical protein GLOTRDRAFT_103590 [Gloeophyllum trabeum ATCC 11539]
MSGSSDILLWTSQDPRESQLFNAYGVTYRFHTDIAASGLNVTTLWRTIRPGREDRVAKLEWAPNGGLGRVIIGKTTFPMADLVRPDPQVQGARVFNGPDGLQYRWRPNRSSRDIILQDPNGITIALFRPVTPQRYQLGDVYTELHFLRTAGAGTVTHPPFMDYVTVTATLYRFVMAFGL